MSETRKNTSYNEAFSTEGRRHRVNDVARKAMMYNDRVDDNQPQSPSDVSLYIDIRKRCGNQIV